MTPEQYKKNLPANYREFNLRLTKIREIRKKKGCWWRCYKDRYDSGVLSVKIEGNLTLAEHNSLAECADRVSNSWRYVFYNVPSRKWPWDSNLSTEENWKIIRTMKKLGFSE